MLEFRTFAVMRSPSPLNITRRRVHLKHKRITPSAADSPSRGCVPQVVAASFSTHLTTTRSIYSSFPSPSLSSSSLSSPFSTATKASTSLPEQLASDLATLLGPGKVSRNESEINNHGSIEDGYVGWNPPDVLVYAESSKDVQEAVRLCSEREVPVVPYGAGTSVEGHLDCPRGGVMLDLSRMDQVIEVNEQDMDCRIQAGVTREQLNAHLKGSGLFFSVDPGGNATIGGMVSTNASGTTTMSYGSMRQNVLGLQVVNPSGDIVGTGGRARKSSAGYDLTRLFIGAEGTLGVITEVTVKLHPEPEANAAAVCCFPDIESAVEAVTAATMVSSPARMELLDDVTMGALNGWRGQSFTVAPTIFFEFHGGPAAVAEQLESVEMLVKDFGGSEWKSATLQEERTALWAARHNAFWAIKDKWAGKDLIATDIAVPVSNLAELVSLTKSDIQDLKITAAPLFGHVGDGSFHLLPMFDSSDEDEVERVKQLEERMTNRAIELGGTCSGEHGIGTGKIKYLNKEHGGAAVAMMRCIKQSIDPKNIMNPGKILP